jgi:hypothetical protein
MKLKIIIIIIQPVVLHSIATQPVVVPQHRALPHLASLKVPKTPSLQLGW